MHDRRMFEEKWPDSVGSARISPSKKRMKEKRAGRADEEGPWKSSNSRQSVRVRSLFNREQNDAERGKRGSPRLSICLPSVTIPRKRSPTRRKTRKSRSSIEKGRTYADVPRYT